MASVLDSVKNNNIPILKVLLKVPQSIKKNDLDLGLLQAAKLGHTECVSCILATKYVCQDISDSHGNTPLFLSVQADKPEVVKLLVNNGDTINTKGVGKCSPLHVAAKLGNEECLDILIINGANLNSRDSVGNTPLILAAKHSHLLIMQKLLNVKCDINSKNNDGWTALHYCSRKAMGVDILLEAGADVNIADRDNITPLLMAATEGFDRVVKTLIKAGCQVNMASKLSNKTALHVLTYKGHTDCVGNLIEAGADVNIYDFEYHTPLWYAIKNKQNEIAKFLLRANCMVDTFQCAGHIPLEECPITLALTLDAVDIIKLFILTGYDKAHMKTALQTDEMREKLKKFDIDHWFDRANDIRSLKHTCRIWIRHHLGNSFYHNVMELPIPQVMRDFIFMKEIDEDH
ncbi:ankyrin homolog [Mytilus edulis]|uniref:ankyrin homolog n=1 Tax=Mytilus edulis TaxID=6550 RepID=UPI0039EFA28C